MRTQCKSNSLLFLFKKIKIIYLNLASADNRVVSNSSSSSQQQQQQQQRQNGEKKTVKDVKNCYHNKVLFFYKRISLDKKTASCVR